MYPCEAEHSSELSFEIGAIFEDGECSGSFVVGYVLSTTQNVYRLDQAVPSWSIVSSTSLSRYVLDRRELVPPRNGRPAAVWMAGTHPCLHLGYSPTLLTLWVSIVFSPSPQPNLPNASGLPNLSY